jgi:hypothetical protein
VDERQFLVLETNRENHRIYYRVKANGVEFPSLVCILASQRSTYSEEELKTWCKNNSARLESGVILQADLSTINNDESPQLGRPGKPQHLPSGQPAMHSAKGVAIGTEIKKCSFLNRHCIAYFARVASKQNYMEHSGRFHLIFSRIHSRVLFL